MRNLSSFKCSIRLLFVFLKWGSLPWSCTYYISTNAISCKYCKISQYHWNRIARYFDKYTALFFCKYCKYMKLRSLIQRHSCLAHHYISWYIGSVCDLQSCKMKNKFKINLKGLAQANIIKKSVILFRVLNMTIWCKHVHRLELQIFIIFVQRVHQLG